MSTLSIVVAIIAAVILLFRHAAAPKKPRFTAGERLSEKALLLRLEILGKRCAVTSRGFGINYNRIGINRIISDIADKIKNNRALDDWEAELYISRKRVAEALEKSKRTMRKSYMLGHVDGYPRLYLLCNEIVKYTQGDISNEFLINAVGAFEKYAPLDKREQNGFAGVMSFCLCGLLFGAAVDAKKYAQYYDKGANDGKKGKVDLDYIAYGDYVCGLCDCAPETDKAAIERLLESNGISHNDAALERRMRLAKTCALVECTVKSIERIDSVAEVNKITDNYMLSKNEPKRSFVLVFSVAPLVCIGISAILFCIFAPPWCAALFTVISILIYAAFRLPMLIRYPKYYCVDFSSVVNKVKNKFSRKKSRIGTEPIRKESEIAFFGGEPSYAFNRTDSGRISVTADNRGRVTVGSTQRVFKPSALKIICMTGEREIGLEACDGVFEKHKSVYRAALADMEISAEFIAPIDCDGCCCKISVISRDNKPKTVGLAAFYAKNIEAGGDYTANGIIGGVAVKDGDNGMLALAFDRPAEYGGDLCEYTNNNGLMLGKCKSPAAIGVSEIKVDGFSKTTMQLVAVHGKSERELERAIEHVNRKGYFDYAESCAKVFCGLNGSNDIHGLSLPELAEIKKKNKPLPTPYTTPSLKPIYCDISLPQGGLTESGDFAVSVNESSRDRKYRNVLSDGDIEATLMHDGDIIISSKISNGCITRSREIFSSMPQILTVIGENGIMWSPTFKPLGKGEMRTVHSFTHTEYESAYNGCLSSLKVYLARKKNAVVFDLNIKNTENKKRNIDVMFSVAACHNAEITKNGNSVFVDCSERSFAVTSSETIKDFTEYKEGYFVRGKIDRCGAFRSGGSTPAPTVSVRLKLDSNGNTRAVFCIIVTNDKNDLAGTVNADECFQTEVEYFKRFWKIKLHSNDSSLNCMYKRALYQAYICGLNEINFFHSVTDMCALLYVAKYVNAKATKRHIINLLKRQFENGFFSKSDESGIYVAALVSDFVEYTRDYGFFDEYVPFMPQRIHGKLAQRNGTVLSHCLLAVDSALGVRADNASDLAYLLCRDKIYIDVLHYYSEFCNSDISRKTAYINALGTISAVYDKSLRRFKACNFFRTEDNENAIVYARALYLIGEYDKAYGILNSINPINAVERIGVDNFGHEPYMFGKSDKTEGTVYDGAVVAALYFATVTECLIGLKLRGAAVKLNPCTAFKTPHLEFDISANGGNAHIVIDDGEKTGDWLMCVDKIEYGMTSFAPDKYKGATVTFYKSGEH